ncbi:hypothetical protein QYE76_003067 [Lolium multiflorum]|uniref:Uncharacterized protein n=1 Tax=Lolium multiflorum TaxID=4521 RepID=A0AAD8RQV7_LOLMU|nr:hypothetical protein QYE76_003067 [Lolium multiflorum]
MAKAAAALLPGLLPTPPMSTIAPCLIILPTSFASKPKPGRADSVERWDAHKKDRKTGSPSSSSCGSSSPGRASSSGERWDINKKCGSSSVSSTCSSSSSSRGSIGIPGRASLCDKWDSNKRAPSRTSSADRWDIHKKPRSAQADAESRTGEPEEREINDKQSHEEEIIMMVPRVPRMDPVFSGSSFFTSPEPNMLPMPTFLRSRCPGMMPVPAH